MDNSKELKVKWKNSSKVVVKVCYLTVFAAGSIIGNNTGLIKGMIHRTPVPQELLSVSGKASLKKLHIFYHRFGGFQNVYLMPMRLSHRWQIPHSISFS